MKNVYLFFAIVGTIVPYLFFGQFILVEGVDLAGFLAALFANPAAAGFTADLLITSAMFWFWMWNERRNGVRTGIHPLLFVALNLVIGLSCALPAYLYAKERASTLKHL